MNDRVTQIEQRLRTALQPLRLEIKTRAPSMPAMPAHAKVAATSTSPSSRRSSPAKAFCNATAWSMMHSRTMRKDIHALSIHAFSPDEA